MVNTFNLGTGIPTAGTSQLKGLSVAKTAGSLLPAESIKRRQAELTALACMQSALALPLTTVVRACQASHYL